MKNKIISVLIIFILIFISGFNNFSYAGEQYTYCGKLKLIKRYQSLGDKGEYWISGVLSPSTTPEIKVPKVADDNLPITRISDNTSSRGVFQGNLFLTKVDLSESGITYIGAYSFKSCMNLTDFQNSKYLTEIGINAFQNANLNSITLYDGLEKIRSSAFEDAFSDENKLYVINIPDSVTEIRENAFKVTNKKYRVILVGQKGSLVENYCETDSTCTFMERGERVPTAEEVLQEEIRKEKSKIFENPKFIHHDSNYNNTDDADKVYCFGLPASTLSSSNSEQFCDMVKVGNEVVVIGHSYLDKYNKYSNIYLSQAKGNQDAIIVKYNSNLDTQVFKSFGGSLNDKFEQIYKLKDGRYLVLGKTTSRDKDLQDININTSNYQSMAVIYDRDLNVISTKMGEYSNIYEEYKEEIVQEEKNKVSDGRFILDTISDGKTGVSSGINGYEMNAIITKYDDDGHKQWSKTFDRNSSKTNDRLTKVVEVDDGYIFIGSSSITNNLNPSVYLQDAIIVKYKPPYDQIMIMGSLQNKIDIGQEKKLDLYYVPWEDVTIGEMNWSSENEDIATVDYKGNVTGKSEGETKIHLSIRGKTAVVLVEINDPTLKHIEGITLNKTEITLEKDRTETLIATILPTDTLDDKTISWTSNNTAVATVSEDGTVTGVSEGRASIIATTSNGKIARCKINVINPKVSSIVLNKETMELPKGKQEKLTATVTPTDAENKEIDWKTSNPNIATVSEDGIVTGVSKGEVTITATAKDGSGVKATCEVTVTFIRATSIELNEYDKTLETGETYRLIATVKPENAINKEVSWSSSDERVATIDENGVITAASAGTITITAHAKDNYGIMAICNIKVVIRAKNITLNKTELNLQKGQTETLTARLEPFNTTEKEVKWSSDNRNVAKVNEKGNIEAISEGTATITATTSNGKTATCLVTVKAPDPETVEITGISLNKTNLSLEEGKTEILTATINPSNTTQNKTIMWSNDNPNVATVDSNGKVIAISAGTTKITAITSNGKMATCTVTVTATSTPEEPVKPDPTPIKGALGDTDGNEKITTKDAKMVLQHIVKKIKLTEEQIKRADTDKNNKITTKDAKMILQHIVKKIILK